MNATTSLPRKRLELVLAKPAIGWFPKPTVVLGGRGQPSQWGRGTWQVEVDEHARIQVFLFNRLWKFGKADFLLGIEPPGTLIYTAPLLPFLPGKLRALSANPQHTSSDAR